jgi:hypothetical protein
MSDDISLTPAFSPVTIDPERQNRFNGFGPAGKPLKRLARRSTFITRLKPGVNENT